MAVLSETKDMPGDPASRNIEVRPADDGALIPVVRHPPVAEQWT